MTALEQPRRLGGFGARIFDRLRFVENHIVESLVFELNCIATERAVGGEDQVVVVEMIDSLQSFDTRVIEDSELWRKLRGFLFPVEYDRSGHDYKRWPRATE